MLQQQIDTSVRAALHALAVAGGYRRYLGDNSERLPHELAERMQVAHVLLTSSGTTALELALRAAGIGDGDEVLLSAYDYPGNFWAIERVGARPVLVDVVDGSWQLDRRQLDASAQAGELANCKALVISHLHGELQDAQGLRGWAEANRMWLIEDACQAVGARIQDRNAGGWGHFGILSFGGGKVLSSGRGGALLTDDHELVQKARIAAGAGSGPNTMSELQAATIRAQLPWLDKINQHCCDYFQRVAHELQSRDSRLEAPFTAFLPHTSFYQAGFVVPVVTDRAVNTADDRVADMSESSAIESTMFAWLAGLREAGLPAGMGFSGFHRRSSRRCRRLAPLNSTASIVQQTCTLHHSVALLEQHSAEHTAELLGRALPA